MGDMTRPVSDPPGLPVHCHQCGAVDKRLIYEPDKDHVVRAVCLKCRTERGRDNLPPRMVSK